MDKTLEITVSASYNRSSARRIRLLKLLRIALAACLFMSWTYGIAVAAAFVQEGSGAATLWMLQFVIFTIPATVFLILVCIALGKLTRVYEYCLEGDTLEIWNSGANRRKLVAQINCFSIVSLAAEADAPDHVGRVIHAEVSKHHRCALDVRHDGQIVRIWLHPDDSLLHCLKKYTQ